MVTSVLCACLCVRKDTADKKNNMTLSITASQIDVQVKVIV